MEMSGGETVDDIVALATLESFDGVDGDFIEFVNIRECDIFFYSGYLGAIRHNDTE